MTLPPILLLVTGLGGAAFAWGTLRLGTQLLARWRHTAAVAAQRDLRELFLFADPRTLFGLHAGLVIGAVALAWVVTRTWPATAAAALLALLTPRGVLALLRRRRLRRLEAQLPDALQVMAGALRAGASLTAAMQQLVAQGRPPVTQEFSLVLREQRLGVNLDVALANLDARLPLQAVTLAVAAMRIALETGGGLAEALERAAATLRAKLAMEGKIRALTSQGKLQALVVGLLPMLMLAVLLRMEPHDMGLIFTTRIGWIVLGVVGLLECFGVLLIRRIVAIDV